MHRAAPASLVFATLFAAALTHGVQAQNGAAMCRISGVVASARTPLPGVTITVRTAAGAATATTSTGTDGRYELPVPTASQTLSAELTGFTGVEQPLDASSCGRPLDIDLQIAPRATVVTAAPGRGVGNRFETLRLQRRVAGPPDAAVDSEEPPPPQLALPPGFSTETPQDTVAFNGGGATVDRGQLNNRFEALSRGDVQAPPTDAAGFLGERGFAPPAAGLAGRGGGRPGGGGPAGGGGPGAGAGGGRGPAGAGNGRGGFGGRDGSETQPIFTFNSGYTFGGSALDASPYQLRPDATQPDPDYLRHTVDVNVGGPLLIPRVYDGTGRTSFALNFSRNRGDALFDQYATVPTAAMRTGDFSAIQRPLIDQETGALFPDNQVPAERLDPSAVALLRYIPQPTLDGSARNFRHVATTDTTADNLNLRVNHNFTPNLGRGGRGGGAVAGGAGEGRGRGGTVAAQNRTAAALNVQVQYRRNDGDRHDVFPTLSGMNEGSSLTVPVRLNVTRRRVQHSFNVNLSRTRSATRNQYAFNEDVAGNAGITGVSSDPFAWGVPSLSFAGLTSVNDITPSSRTDTRLTMGYTWSRPAGRHTFRAGGEIRHDRASSRTDSNARGTFLFTGLYSGHPFADFLLGTPQQASVHYGPGDVSLTGRAVSLFLQDNWRRGARLTFNLGVRYELTLPLVEQSDRLVNLDVAPDFTAVAPVSAGHTGQFSGSFPDALVRTDVNNLAPRLGFAWRAAQGTVVRGGYGVTFNAGTYSQIARQLASQPPYAITDTVIGGADDPLLLAHAFATAAAASTTNNFGVSPDYQLGRVQTWNIDLNRDLTRSWTAGAGHTFAVGSSLDLVRAPNRGPDGLRLPDVQPFLWQTSESSSRLHSATFRLRRRQVNGIGGDLTYTLARSRDNASTIGGATTVAQDDRNLDAEWGLSSFDRRHQIAGNLTYDLPFGPNRRWLTDKGLWTRLAEMWTFNVNVRIQSGTPLTARVMGSSSDAARGTNGTLRADYDGEDISVNEPTIDRYFNTAAFAIPASGTFGTSGRNLIIGPGSKDVSARLTRDVSVGGSRTLTIQLRANNLLNMVNYAAVDTAVNSPSFGQVTAVRPMRSIQLTLRFTY